MTNTTLQERSDAIITNLATTVNTYCVRTGITAPGFHLTEFTDIIDAVITAQEAIKLLIQSERREAAEEALRKDGEMAALIKQHAGEKDFERYVKYMTYPKYVISGIDPGDLDIEPGMIQLTQEGEK